MLLIVEIYVLYLFQCVQFQCVGSIAPMVMQEMREDVTIELE